MPGTTTSDHPSHHSPTSVVSAPSWAPPRSPLPPHKLAKLANALGVSTPLPAVHSYGSSLSTSPPIPNSSTCSSFSDHFRRSPTPSATSVQTFTSSASSTKYFLHVVPPAQLPHDSETLDDPDLLPPPPGASGYHTQFRRGILVPVYSTLSTQLAAIAKEYALPSTVGLILYLVITSGSTHVHVISDEYPNNDATERDEPGPRISDDIWRQVWLRVVRSEMADSLPTGPRPIGLGLGITSQIALSPFPDASSPSFRPPVSPAKVEVPQSQLSMTPSPSTASQSVFSSQSGIEPPESTSSICAGLDPGSDDLPLPGLQSPALIPILAKVEFDIDRRKAAWYEPWLRSRRVNYAKRAESRSGMRRRADSRVDNEEEDHDNELKKAPLDLELVARRQSPPSGPSFLYTSEEDDLREGYAELSEEPAEAEDDESVYESDDADPTARILTGANGDPLAGVFGTDAETWADLHAQSRSSNSPHEINPNVVDLALDGAALSTLSDHGEDKAEDRDEEEVTELWNQHARPSLIVSIPSPPSSKRQSSPTTAGTMSVRKHPPPPLILAASLPVGEGVAVQGSPQPPSSSGSVCLPYLEGATPPQSSYQVVEHVDQSEELSISVSEEGQSQLGEGKIRSPENEKRDGAFFEDLDLGLDLDDETIEYDESDPHDRRRSQFIMKAQLDEIERNLIQLSPRRLQSESIDEESPIRPLYSATLSPPPQWGPPRLNSAQTSMSPPTGDLPLPGGGVFWPAVPYSSLNGAHMHSSSDSSSRPGSNSRPPSPPLIAFNGASPEPPMGALSKRSRSGMVSNETLARQQDERELYPPLVPPTLLMPRNSGDSPIIPLSPDPFGRYPSEAEANRLEEERQSVVFQDGRPLFSVGNSAGCPPVPRKVSLGQHDLFNPDDRQNTQTPSSRFSLDSVTSEDAGKSSKGSSLVSMKNIKKLWRKTNSKLSLSGSVTPILESGRSSPNLAPNGQEQPTGRRASRSVSKSPQPFEIGSTVAPVSPPKTRRKASIPSMQYTQDPRNSMVPSRTLPLDGPRHPSPALPPLPPSATPSPSVSPLLPSPSPQFGSTSPQIPSPVPEKNGGVRKSILKSWRSASGSLSVQTNSSSASTPRSSSELLGDAPMKRRRPSILDGVSSIRRGSTTSMSTSTLVDIPPSPALPDEFAAAQGRKRSSQSGFLGGGAGRRMSARPRPSPSLSSTSTTSSSYGRSTPGMSPPKGGVLSRQSEESTEGRPSVDVSQFEIVSPKLDAHTLEHTLSYPYHALDHSMTSSVE